MYTDQLEIVGTYSDEHQNQSYQDMLKEKDIEYTVLNKDEFLEVSPRQYQVITQEMKDKVSPDMIVVSGKYQGEGRELFFVEINVSLGKGAWNHSTLIYDQEPTSEDMMKILDNYQNFMIHDTTDQLVM